jgi:quercetin dioxygenase-like cupin family protein
MGSLFEHLVGAADTGGLLGVSIVTQPPGVATPLHRHTHEAEAFLVLEGQLSYRAGDDVHELDAGSVGPRARTDSLPRWSFPSGPRSHLATG